MLDVKITTGVQLILRTRIKAVDITTETFAVYKETRKYPLRWYILGSGAPGTPGVTHKTCGTTFIGDIL